MRRPPAVPATDRQRTGKNLSRSAVLGVDTLTFRGRVDPAALQGLPVQRHKTNIDFVTGEVLAARTSSDVDMASGVTLRVDSRRGPVEARIEASLPRLRDGHNCHPLPISEVPELVRLLHAQASDWVQWQCAPNEVKLMRVDLVRDFEGVLDGKRLLTGLSRQAVPRIHSRAYVNPGEAQVQTLTRFTDRWAARLYDRSGSYQQHARATRGHTSDSYWGLAQREAGKLRYELELKSRFLKDYALDTLPGLLATNVTDLAETYFRKAGFDRVAALGVVGLHEAAMRLKSEGSYNQFPAVLGQLWIEALGLPQAASAPSRRNYLNKAQAAGITVEDLLQQSADTRRLDFHLGVVPIR